MTTTSALGVALVALAALLVVLAGSATAVRAARLARERRRAARAAPYRQVLLQVAAGDPEESEGALRTLAGLDATRWTAVEPAVVRLLHKVRGETHEAVVSLLERRGTIDAARRRTRSRSLVARAEAAELLGATRRARGGRQLVPLLTDPQPEVRQVAARALSRSGDPACVGPLLGALSGARPVPARVVAGAVLRLGAAAHPGIARALTATDRLERATAADLAGLSGALTCAPALAAAVTDDDDLEVRIRAARALGRLGLPVALAPLVAATDAHQPAALRAVAARALGDLGDVRAVPHLVPLLAPGHHHVAANAARSLAALGAPGRAALETALDGPGAAHARDALATLAIRQRAGVPT